jgi:hypothetical protein
MLLVHFWYWCRTLIIFVLTCRFLEIQLSGWQDMLRDHYWYRTVGTWKSSRVGGRIWYRFTHYLYRYWISILCSNVQVPGNSVEWRAEYVTDSLPTSISNIVLCSNVQVPGNPVEWAADSLPTSISNIDYLFSRVGSWNPIEWEAGYVASSLLILISNIDSLL